MKTAQTIEAQSDEKASPHGKPKNTRPKSKLTPEMEIRKWKPGQSGNPSGRPKNDIAQQIAAAIFSQNPELIYQAFSQALKKGNAYAFQVLSERAYGKLKETKEVTHKYEDVADNDLQGEIDSILQRLGLARDADRAAEIGRAAIGAGKASE